MERTIEDYMANYKIKEASDITGLSQQVIYKYLDYFSTLFNGSVKTIDGVSVLTEEGISLLEEIKSRKDTTNTRLKDILKSFQEEAKASEESVEDSVESVEKTVESVKNSIEVEILREQVNYLKEQIEKKDDQIAELHQIIALQEKNAFEQQKMLEDMSNISLWRRLKTAFGFSSSAR